MAARRYLLMEANLRQLRAAPPRVAVLPWGATEAHNYHLPYGTDVWEAQELATAGAKLATDAGARVVVLPAIPFGNDEQQLDQIATISIRTATAAAILDDVARSLTTQGVGRLVIANCHGGNQFQPLIRDVQGKYPILVVVANLYQMAPEAKGEIFERAGDHADELETSLMLHLRPELVELDQAGPGKRIPFAIDGLDQAGVWTPRPWSRSHPDTGSGDPSLATAEKGRQYFDAVAAALATLLIGVDAAEPGHLPL